MKKIVIMGSSPAGVKAAEEIRLADPESLISIFGEQRGAACNRFLFPELLANEIPQKKLFYRDEDFYQRLNIELIPDKKIVRLNPKRNRIVVEDDKETREEITYDILIITDAAANKLPAVKGTQRAGVFSLRRFFDVQAILNFLPLTETIVVQSESWGGLKTSEALRKRNKEVIWVNPAKFLFSSILDESAARSLKQQLEAQGIRVIEDNPIAEILGDSDTRAVRLKSGKVLAAEMIIFPDSEPDLKVYAEGGLSASPRIAINQKFQTSVDNIFALDEAGDFATAFSSRQLEPSLPALAILEEQGKTAAAVITGQEHAFSPPVNQNSTLAELQKLQKHFTCQVS